MAMACAGSARKVSAVLYHYPCPDGAFAALAAHLYFSAAALPVRFFPNTVYDPIRSDDLPFDEIKDVYLLDFVGPPGFVADIAPKVQRILLKDVPSAESSRTVRGLGKVLVASLTLTKCNVRRRRLEPGTSRSQAVRLYRCTRPALHQDTSNVTILDHHKTAMENLCGRATLGENVNKVIDMQRSGATIAFDYFSNKLLTEASTSRNHGSGNAVTEVKYLPDNKLEMVHKLFKLIEDGDLWRWTIPNSKAFSSGLKDLDIEFNVNENGKLFDQLLELDPEQVISRGQVTLSQKQTLIADCLEKSYEIALGCGQFGNCLAVNADAIAKLRSELGNQLADKSQNLNLRAIGAVVYKVPELNNDQMLKISLRSLGQEDTTSISQEYGGGGHRNASSFLLSVAEFERWKVGDEPSNPETA